MAPRLEDFAVVDERAGRSAKSFTLTLPNEAATPPALRADSEPVVQRTRFVRLEWLKPIQRDLRRIDDGRDPFARHREQLPEGRVHQEWLIVDDDELFD